MSGDITLVIGVDTTQVDASIAATQAKADAVVKEWRIRRMEIIQGVREGLTLISSMMSSFRMAMSLFGQQLDPFYSALISMVLATTSMLLSAGSALAATGIAGGIAAVVFGVAMGFNLVTMGKLINDKLATEGVLEQIQNNLTSAVKAGVLGQGQFGGAF